MVFFEKKNKEIVSAIRNNGINGIGCPYSLNLQKDLLIMEKHFPNEHKRCELIWKPVYTEYRRLNYRLKSSIQLTMFEEEKL